MSLSKEDVEAYVRLRRYGKPVSVRGFQRLMNYGSPGKAQRVLARLERLGLAERTGSNEYIARESLPPQLAMYVVVKGYLVPRTLIYAAYTTTTALSYVALARPPIHISLLLAALALPYWAEAVRAVRILRVLLSREGRP